MLRPGAVFATVRLLSVVRLFLTHDEPIGGGRQDWQSTAVDVLGACCSCFQADLSTPKTQVMGAALGSERSERQPLLYLNVSMKRPKTSFRAFSCSLCGSGLSCTFKRAERPFNRFVLLLCSTIRGWPYASLQAIGLLPTFFEIRN